MASVEGTVASVKETMQASVDTVKESLDLKGRVERHPWAMLGGAVATGFLGGWLLSGSRRYRVHRPDPLWSEPPQLKRRGSITRSLAA